MLFLLIYFNGFRGLCQQDIVRYDLEARTAYALSNDSGSLYVRLSTADPVQQGKILRNGLELWLDPRAKKNKSFGILFPLPAKKRSNVQQGGGSQQSFDGPPPLSNNSSNDTGREAERKILRSLVNEQQEMKILHISHAEGLRVTIHFSSDSLIYEAEIPFTVFPGPFSFGKPLGIGIIEKGASLPDFGGEEMPGGEGGPPGGGMMPPGPPPGNNPEEESMQKLFLDNIFWIRYTPVLP